MSDPSPENPAPQPLRSKHTSNFPALLEQLGISVLVTTYQAGKLVVLRSAGDSINTHFRDLPRPMGLAADPTRLAVGAAHEIRQYRNMAPVVRRLEPPGRHDACYLARAAHLTGDIDVHEMAWAGDELWFVNTRFSCLCTLNGIHSFVPRWRPPFVTALAPDDRCHLNGLGLAPDADGKLTPRYVTALAATDTPQGWRQHKKDGGVLLDITTNDILIRGLSMPHSPRWVNGRLWLLESGTGGFGYADLAAGRYCSVAELPGFTRGLDLFGNLAFIGMSQVRESAVFSGIPIAERALAERACGVWVVDIRTGHTVAFLRFEDAVQEVFAVKVLPGLRYPEIAPEDPKLLADSYDLPSAALEEVPAALRLAGQSVSPAASSDRPAGP
ncbi:MAG TPA: TIGR03032 family protein [Gemmataceae bacterium]|nr:TIGR03032 family protein [Gemmataceae bacterium]